MRTCSSVLQHYHLLVHPGTEVRSMHVCQIYAAGSTSDYRFGGFQVFSLADADSDDDGPELKQKRVRRKQMLKRHSTAAVQCHGARGGLQILQGRCRY